MDLAAQHREVCRLAMIQSGLTCCSMAKLYATGDNELVAALYSGA